MRHFEVAHKADEGFGVGLERRAVVKDDHSACLEDVDLNDVHDPPGRRVLEVSGVFVDAVVEKLLFLSAEDVSLNSDQSLVLEIGR